MASKAIKGLQMAEPQEETKTSQAAVVYMGGDQGPFRCDHCEYWSAPSSCRIVEGNIDPAGCCNLFEKEEDASGS